MVENPKVGFIGWNPFQFLHIKDLANAISGSVFIVEKKNESLNEFSEEFFNDENIPVMIWDRSKMSLLDGIFDVIVCQTPFFRMETFEKTKIVMIQYGYAKEPHNYGAWRSLGDLCLTYGEYANDKIKNFCPAICTGNPRYDRWTNPDTFIKCYDKFQSRFIPGLKTILYVPTWGDLSSIDDFLESVMALSGEYNVILKLHHNTDLLEGHRKNRVNGRINYFGANDDLLELISVSDIVISDYSGAIFDAIYFNKPVVLLSKNCNANEMDLKMDVYSIEYAERNNIGYEVFKPEELSSSVKYIFDNIEHFSTVHSEIKQRLFVETKDAVTQAVQAIHNLLNDCYSLTQSQRYIRHVNQELLSTKRKLQIALKNSKSKG
ncbi:Cps2A family protein [Kluyvera georgiana ATCC 51603]|uniref:Cps2A family protein n=1 Tax=Kluyvera georgiana ATCC 51603 TaxID=1354264 RepID=A0A1B7JPV6_9ENTR|nr:CDP-glycerol glycerophosphotransferase family protein [Kluyvera georgiana]OAT49937.1 Cps2A family protein [Kluyvera georgiana ATCC 51603]